MKLFLCLALIVLAAALVGAVVGLALAGAQRGRPRDPRRAGLGLVVASPAIPDAAALVRDGVAEFEARAASRERRAGASLALPI